MKTFGRPITPAEARNENGGALPSEVYESFNELLAARSAEPIIVITQSEVVDRILGKLRDIGVAVIRQRIFAEHWLDIEAEYRKAGWRVNYDKPGTYGASWEFEAAKKPKS